MRLKRVANASKTGHKSEAFISRQAGGMSFDFNKDDSNTYDALYTHTHTHTHHEGTWWRRRRERYTSAAAATASSTWRATPDTVGVYTRSGGARSSRASSSGKTH